MRAFNKHNTRIIFITGLNNKSQLIKVMKGAIHFIYTVAAKFQSWREINYKGNTPEIKLKFQPWLKVYWEIFEAFLNENVSKFVHIYTLNMGQCLL